MSSAATPRPIELLAPALNSEVARQAILHGADAVYMGASSHGARAAATNSVADLAFVADMAHRYGARVYATVNTIVYENELQHVERLAWKLYRAGVDALIVQDMGLLRLDLPPIDLHASTQCDIRTPAKAQFMADVGFSQIVLPRELTLAEIAAVRSTVSSDVTLEAFVHGALCVSYSGDCQAGWVTQRRSANRGECPQLCRLPYNLVDGDTGRVIMRGKHLLSLRDLNRSASIASMLNAGVASLKIEGRLKDAAYVKNAVTAYRRAIDAVIDAEPGRYCRASFGQSEVSFTPALEKGFNRRFTQYFITATPSEPLADFNTPKSIGQKVAVTIAPSRGTAVKVRTSLPLANGDGLVWFDKDGSLQGFRVNRIDGNTIHTASPLSIPRGIELYRNRDKAWDDFMASDTATRTVKVDFNLRLPNPSLLVLDATDETNLRVTATIQIEPQHARSPQGETRQRLLRKTGGTGYRVGSIDDQIGTDTFVAASVLAELRRRALALLDSARRATHPYKPRRKESAEAMLPAKRITYHDNVANSAARDFYASHRADTIEPALETLAKHNGTVTVMTTRYCLRRELGACLRTPSGTSLPLNLKLDSPALHHPLTLCFDCAECRMRVVTNHHTHA